MLNFIYICFFMPSLNYHLTAFDMKDKPVFAPCEIIQEQSKFYLLDRSSKAIYVYDQKGFLFQFGRAGQGPGEFESPRGMALYKDNLYTIDSFSAKVNVFDLKGKVVTSFSLHGSSQDNAFIGDILIIKDQILVCYNKGLVLVRIYSLNGELKGEIRKAVEPYPRGISNLYELHAKGDGTTFYVFSRLDGSLMTLSLDQRSVVEIKKTNLPIVAELVTGLIEEKQQESDSKSENIEVIELEAFFPLQMQSDKLTAIATKILPNQTYQAITIDRGTSHVHNIPRPDFSERTRFLATINQKTFIYDAEGNLFASGGVL